MARNAAKAETRGWFWFCGIKLREEARPVLLSNNGLVSIESPMPFVESINTIKLNYIRLH